jgi:hypothetical protein
VQKEVVITSTARPLARRSASPLGSGAMLRKSIPSLITLIWLAVGIVVALNHGYNTIKNLSQLLSLVLGVILWPAILLGYDLHVTIGG